MANLNHALIHAWFRSSYLVGSVIHVVHKFFQGGYHSAIQLDTSGSLSEMMTSVLHTPAAAGLSAEKKAYIQREIYRNIARLPPEKQRQILQMARSTLR